VLRTVADVQVQLNVARVALVDVLFVLITLVQARFALWDEVTEALPYHNQL